MFYWSVRDEKQRVRHLTDEQTAPLVWFQQALALYAMGEYSFDTLAECRRSPESAGFRTCPTIWRMGCLLGP